MELLLRQAKLELGHHRLLYLLKNTLKPPRPDDRKVVVVDSLDSYKPPESPVILGNFVVQHLPRYNIINSVFDISTT